MWRTYMSTCIVTTRNITLLTFVFAKLVGNFALPPLSQPTHAFFMNVLCQMWRTYTSTSSHEQET
eukprot:m.43952 g.43952  ORF g.43952 m.43952 type:complete len:65 (-) comp17195_c0_seq2:138-332(-)